MDFYIDERMVSDSLLTYIKLSFMIENFPVEYTLERGIKVTVDKKEPDTYNFVLRSSGKPMESFTYVDDGRPKAEWDERLGFDQLEALRKFWLMNEEVL